MTEPPRFAFGQNWKSYVEQHFDPARVDAARQHLLGFLGCSSLHGKDFLDIGCGSGLHSLAAFEAGAESVTSFDYDAQSVEATGMLRAHAGAPGHWTVRQGSVLDESMMRSLPAADIVYSWGVLHHTGDVWRAIELAALPVKPGGLFYIALYAADVQKPPADPAFWLEVKQRYLNATPWGKRRMVAWYLWRFYFHRGLAFWRVLTFATLWIGYRRKRGMDMLTDVRDWLGGWPMEFCWDADVLTFARERLGFELVNMATGEANSEFLFRRPA